MPVAKIIYQPKCWSYCSNVNIIIKWLCFQSSLTWLQLQSDRSDLTSRDSDLIWLRFDSVSIWPDLPWTWIWLHSDTCPWLFHSNLTDLTPTQLLLDSTQDNFTVCLGKSSQNILWILVLLLEIVVMARFPFYEFQWIKDGYQVAFCTKPCISQVGAMAPGQFWLHADGGGRYLRCLTEPSRAHKACHRQAPQWTLCSIW